MRLCDLPASLNKFFGDTNIDVSMFVKPALNPILDDTVFVNPDGSPSIPTASFGLNCVFIGPMAGPFYNAELKGFVLNSERPLKRLLNWKAIRVLAEYSGKQYYSAILYIKTKADMLNDYTSQNKIKWYDIETGSKPIIEFEDLKRYVQWLKTTTTTEGGSPSS